MAGAAASGAGAASSIISELLGTAADAYSEAEQRKILRRQLEQQERMNKFQRLLSLAQASQSSQDRMAGAQRLFSLRNSGMA